MLEQSITTLRDLIQNGGMGASEHQGKRKPEFVYLQQMGYIKYVKSVPYAIVGRRRGLWSRRYKPLPTNHYEVTKTGLAIATRDGWRPT